MDRRFLDIAIKQLDWERYRRGYGNDAEVVTLKYRLREIDKNGHPVELTESEVAILQNSTKHSIRHILNYDYQLPNAEELRDVKKEEFKKLTKWGQEFAKKKGLKEKDLKK